MSTKLRKYLSKNAKKIRTEKHLTQSEVAEKADLSIKLISEIERGLVWPRDTTLVKLAKGLGVHPINLFRI